MSGAPARWDSGMSRGRDRYRRVGCDALVSADSFSETRDRRPGHRHGRVSDGDYRAAEARGPRARRVCAAQATASSARFHRCSVRDIKAAWFAKARRWRWWTDREAHSRQLEYSR